MSGDEKDRTRTNQGRRKASHTSISTNMLELLGMVMTAWVMVVQQGDGAEQGGGGGCMHAGGNHDGRDVGEAMRGHSRPTSGSANATPWG